MDIQHPQDELFYELINPSLRRCGLYIRHPHLLQHAKPHTHVAMPLKHIDYDIEVTNGLVSTTLEQRYVNPTQKFLEIDFSFPIDPKACIYRFVAEFGNKRIEGVVKEKEEAKKEYQEAVKQGKQAVYAEIDQNSKDILNMEIGNIAPGQQVKICISYLQQLNVQQNTFYQLHLPSTISPRYMNNHPGRQFIPNTPQVSGEYTWTFKLTLSTSRKLVYYLSASHDLSLISQNDTQTETVLCLAKEERPDKDLFLIFTVEDFHLPSYVLGRTDASATAMLSFIPKFCQLSLDDAMQASMVKKELETDMAAAKGEYVFLLDRSGSMGGSRMTKAIEALVLFLQSLPENTHFNVISFGSNSSLLFNSSVKYCKENLNQAIEKVKKMTADMGGTEIYAPLQNILRSKLIEGYPRQIFLLTDGGVSNTEGVIDLVGKQVKYSRCHSIGIGNGCSQALIKGCAQKGKGKYIFISDSENPSQKIISLLEQTLTPVISNVTLNYDPALVQSIVPNPTSLPYILKNQVVNFYITFKQPHPTTPTTFNFSYKDSLNNLPFQTTLTIDPESHNMPFVDKMAHSKVIKGLEAAAKENKPVEEYMYYVKVVDKKKEAVEQSVKHQILSEFTAFICVNKELVDGRFEEVKDTGAIKVQVQPMLPEEMRMRGAKMFDLGVKSSMLASSSKNFAQNQEMKMKKAVARSPAMLAPQMKMSSPQMLNCNFDQQKKSSGGLFGNVVSSVTSFFSGKPSTKDAVLEKESNKRSQKIQTASLSRNTIQMFMPPPPPTMPSCSPVQQTKRKNSNKMQSASLAQLQQEMYQPEGCLLNLEEDFELSQMNDHLAEFLVAETKIQKQLIYSKNRKSKAPKSKLTKMVDEDDEEEEDHDIDLVQQFIQETKTLSIDEVIKQQNVDGSFVSEGLLKQLFSQKFAQILEEAKAKKIAVAIAITYVVVKWIEKHHPGKQYALIVKKAFSFVKKSAKLEDLAFLDLFLS